MKQFIITHIVNTSVQVEGQITAQMDKLVFITCDDDNEIVVPIKSLNFKDKDKLLYSSRLFDTISGSYRSKKIETVIASEITVDRHNDKITALLVSDKHAKIVLEITFENLVEIKVENVNVKKPKPRVKKEEVA